jgi:hypothetical protein
MGLEAPVNARRWEVVVVCMLYLHTVFFPENFIPSYCWQWFILGDKDVSSVILLQQFFFKKIIDQQEINEFLLCIVLHYCPFWAFELPYAAKRQGGLWVTTDKHVLVNFSSLTCTCIACRWGCLAFWSSCPWKKNSPLICKRIVRSYKKEDRTKTRTE